MIHTCVATRPTHPHRSGPACDLARELPDGRARGRGAGCAHRRLVGRWDPRDRRGRRHRGPRQTRRRRCPGRRAAQAGRITASGDPSGTCRVGAGPSAPPPRRPSRCPAYAYARAGATSNSATSSHRVFHQFQQGTGQRIRHKRVAEDSGDEVDYGDIVKGYEIDKGRYLIVTKEELEAIEPAAAERSRSKTSSTWRTSIPSLGTRPTTLGLRRTSERRGPTRY